MAEHPHYLRFRIAEFHFLDNFSKSCVHKKSTTYLPLHPWEERACKDNPTHRTVDSSHKARHQLTYNKEDELTINARNFQYIFMYLCSEKVNFNKCSVDEFAKVTYPQEGIL